LLEVKEATLTRIERKWAVLAVALALVALALALAACGSSTTTTTASPAESPKAGGTFTWGEEADPGGIAPWTVYESVGWNINHQAFEGLVKYTVQPDGTMKTEPDIAESYSSPDGRVWTFKLKQGVMFGPPVNREVKAQDFVASWDFNSDKSLGTNYTVFVFASIVGTDDSGFRKGATLTGVKAVDDYTLEVTLKKPFYDFPVTTGHPIMMVEPVDYVKQVGVKKYAQKPVGGTGPYMVDAWVPNKYVNMVKNPSWWQAGSGTGPYLDTLQMKRYGNENSEWLDFQKGTIDWTIVPPGQIAAAENNPKVKDGTWSAKKWPELAIEYTNINMKDPVVGGANGLPIRQALAYSADTNAIINVVREGVPVPATGFVPAGIPGSGLVSLPYPYDLNKAKELVAQIGTVPTLNYWTETNSETATKVAEALQAGWKQAGINVKITAYEWNKLNSLQREAAAGDQIGRSGWLADYPLQDDFLYPMFYSTQMGLNGYSFYSNPKFDALIDQARATADQTQRENLYAEAEKLVLGDGVVIPTYFFRAFRVWNSTRIGGLVYSPLATWDLRSAWVK
jgi:oligopeptide transport system substrate-binding protein